MLIWFFVSESIGNIDKCCMTIATKELSGNK